MAAKLSADPMQTADLVECVFCQRRFIGNRIQTHENICKKSSEMIKKPCNTSEFNLNEEVSGQAKEGTGTTKNLISTNWRQRHEQLLQQIKIEKRNARERKHEFARVMKREQ